MKRVPQLDSIRALAILAVFFHHAFRVKMLWMGVDLFFILSGFLDYRSFDQRKASHNRRLFRALLCTARSQNSRALLAYAGARELFFGISWMRHWYLYILLTNLLLPLNIPHPLALDPLWSLAVEEQFYLVWPFAVYFLDERYLRRLLLLLIVLAPVFRGLLHFQNHWPIYTLTPFRMDLLASGALLWLEWQRDRFGIERWGAKIGPMLVISGLTGLAVLARSHISTDGNTRFGNVFIYEFSLFICFGFMLYALSG